MNVSESGAFFFVLWIDVDTLLPYNAHNTKRNINLIIFFIRSVIFLLSFSFLIARSIFNSIFLHSTVDFCLLLDPFFFRFYLYCALCNFSTWVPVHTYIRQKANPVLSNKLSFWCDQMLKWSCFFDNYLLFPLKLSQLLESFVHPLLFCLNYYIWTFFSDVLKPSGNHSMQEWYRKQMNMFYVDDLKEKESGVISGYIQHICFYLNFVLHCGYRLQNLPL